MTTLSRRKFMVYGGMTALVAPSVALAESHDAQKPDNSDLQRQVNQLIKQKRRAGLIASNERTAWSVYDFRAGKKLVSINEERSMQAASMVKAFVALAYFYLNGKNPHRYPYDSRQRRLMEKMLVHSSNKATNTLMQLCGGPRQVARLCQQATRYRFKSLHIVEYIPSGGRTYQNRIPARDYSRFLYDLWYGKLPRAQEIKRIMSMENGDRIRTDVMPEQLTITDKTGSTSRLCGDMGIIQFGHDKAYTFVGIIERSNRSGSYSRWIKRRGDVMRDVSELVYQFMDTRYRLLNSIG